jgi:uncharacterized membrane protein
MKPLVAASLNDWIHLLHIVASMVWVGGVVTLSAFATQILRRGDRDGIARFVGGLRVIGPLVFAPAPLVLIATGIWSVIDNDAWDFGQTWVWLAIALLLAAFLFGAVFQSRAAINAGRGAATGDDREAARQLGRWSRGSWLILLILLVAAWDMVFKPGL